MPKIVRPQTQKSAEKENQEEGIKAYLWPKAFKILQGSPFQSIALLPKEQLKRPILVTAIKLTKITSKSIENQKKNLETTMKSNKTLENLTKKPYKILQNQTTTKESTCSKCLIPGLHIQRQRRQRRWQRRRFHEGLGRNRPGLRGELGKSGSLEVDCICFHLFGFFSTSTSRVF